MQGDEPPMSRDLAMSTAALQIARDEHAAAFSCAWWAGIHPGAVVRVAFARSEATCLKRKAAEAEFAERALRADEN